MKKLRAILFANLGWKALSLATAIVLWWAVASEPELATFATVRLGVSEPARRSGNQFGAGQLHYARGCAVPGELRGVGDGGIHPAVILDMSDVYPGSAPSRSPAGTCS